jgi:NTP pyrophosphatase (non-canonical NTP hydrolase)
MTATIPAPPELIAVAGSDPYALAVEVVARLRALDYAGREDERQAVALVEEAGEFVGAYRRWAGMARRAGRWLDVELEAADVSISTHVLAVVFEIPASTLTHLQETAVPRLRATATGQVLALNTAAAAVAQLWVDGASLGSDPAQLRGRLAVALADVLAELDLVAAALDIDLPAARQLKARSIFSRSWKDPR